MVSPKYFASNVCFPAAGMNSDSPLPVASIVDEIWHTCILQTKEYERICRKAGFHGILHHRSASSVHVIEPDEELGLSWLANYVGQIDEFTDETLGYWPAAMNLVRKMGWSVQQLNGFCQHIFRKAAHAR